MLQHPVPDEGVVLELGELVGPEVEADQTLEVLQRAQPGQWSVGFPNFNFNIDTTVMNTQYS